jgi:hypothetical protein
LKNFFLALLIAGTAGVVIFFTLFIWNTISGMRKELESREMGVPLAAVAEFTVIGKIGMSYLQFVTFFAKIMFFFLFKLLIKFFNQKLLRTTFSFPSNLVCRLTRYYYNFRFFSELKEFFYFCYFWLFCSFSKLATSP